MIDRRILICAVASIVGHYAVGEALSQLPERDHIELPRTVEVRVISPPVEPPPPDPLPPEPPKPEPPKPEPTKLPPRTTAKPVNAPIVDVVAKDTPPAEHAVVADTTTQPVFGVTMESTTPGGSGPAVPVGNTTQPQPGTAVPTAAPKPLAAPVAAPVAAHEVTKMPLPQGRCSGTYTDEAREAALEGTVILDLIVDEKGRARDIHVVEGLAHGLTEAAIKALETCRFTPGERDGKPVPVRVRSFKIRFLLQDGG